jgi:carbon storage regulator
MLVLTRKTGEEIQIGPTITVKVLRTWRNRTKLGISAPAEVPLVRGELNSRLGCSARRTLEVLVTN